MAQVHQNLRRMNLRTVYVVVYGYFNANTKKRNYVGNINTLAAKKG